MAVTFGVMLHVNRESAAVVRPIQPVIEATVISQRSTAVSPIENSHRTDNAITYADSRATAQTQTYNFRGQQPFQGDSSGMRLDIFA